MDMNMNPTKAEFMQAMKLHNACDYAHKHINAVFKGLPEDMRIELDEWVQGIVLGDARLRFFWGWAVKRGLLPAYAMHNLDMREARYLDADLTCSDFTGTNFTKARVTNCTFEQSVLVNTDFSHAIALECHFTRANAQNAKFSHADLRGAVFRFADLRGADFTQAKLTGASFACTQLEGARFVGCDLRDVRLLNFNDQTVDFTDAILPELQNIES